MNAAAFQEMRRIWRVTTVLRDQRGMMLFGWLALACAVVGEIGAGLIVLAHQASPLVLLRVLCGVGAFWLGFVWMMLFVPASVVLNSPANARLVPRQRRRLVQMAAASWLLITTGITFATGEWAAFPAAGLALIGFGMVRAGRNEAAPLFIIGVNWQTLSRWVLPSSVVNAVGSDAGLLILSALIVPAGLWALRGVYPAAGDSHLSGRGQQIASVDKFGWGETDNLGPLSRLSKGIHARFYNALLQRDLRRARPGALFVHMLGPGVHWSFWIVSMASMPLVSLALRLLLAWRGGTALRDFVDGPLSLGMVAMTIVILLSTVTFSLRIRKTTGEQSLLRLTPLAGDAALLNRRLATALLVNALASWLMLTVSALLATAIIDTGAAILLRQGALCVLAGQLAMFGLLGDFAGDGGWNVPRAVQAGLLGVFELLLALGLDRFGGASGWVWLAAIAAAFGTWQLRHAWRKMLAAAPAFPAGRMG